MVALYLKALVARIHGIYVPHTRGVDKVRGGLNTYVVSFPGVLYMVKGPVQGCPAVAHSVGQVPEHFMYHHFLSNVAVVQEGVEPLPCY